MTDTPDVAIIRSIATEVFAMLGAGHTETVYHNAMKVGLHDAKLKFESERDILLTFRDRYVGTVRADLVIENRLIVELKSIVGSEQAISAALEQCRMYMHETGIPAGVVINFPKRASGKLLLTVV